MIPLCLLCLDPSSVSEEFRTYHVSFKSQVFYKNIPKKLSFQKFPTSILGSWQSFRLKGAISTLSDLEGFMIMKQIGEKARCIRNLEDVNFVFSRNISIPRSDNELTVMHMYEFEKCYCDCGSQTISFCPSRQTVFLYIFCITNSFSLLEINMKFSHPSVTCSGKPWYIASLVTLWFFIAHLIQADEASVRHRC